MRFTITRSTLLAALSIAGSVVSKNANAALSSVLIEAREGDIRITGTDNARTAITTVTANVENTGSILLDAAFLAQTVKALPEGVVVFSQGEDFRMDVTAAKSRYKLTGADPTTAIPAPDTRISGAHLQVLASDLRKLLDQTTFAIAPDDNRYGLNGLHLEKHDAALRAVGTDGNRLSWAQVPFTGELTIGRRMLLPRAGVEILRKLTADLPGDTRVSIAFPERAAVASFGDTTLHMRLLEAEFPNYKEVMPKEFAREVTLSRAELLDALRRVGIFATDGAHSVRMAFESGTLTLSSRKLDAGDAREEVAVDLKGEDITMGVNVKLLTDAATAIPTERLVLKMGTNNLHPVLVYPAGDNDTTGHIVMPVRLD